MTSIVIGRLRHIDPRVFTALLTISFLPTSTVSAWTQVVCKPLLSVNGVQDVRPSVPALPRKWIVTINANTRHCATRSGSFEIDFVRIKENAPDLQFTEKFRWQQDKFSISTEMNSDESILSYRIGFVAPCVCRSIADLGEPEQ